MIDLDELERRAREVDKSPWYSIDDLYDAAPHNGDLAFIAAASPDVVLALIARVRAAEAREWRTRDIARSLYGVEVVADTSDAPCLGDYQCRRKTESPRAPACRACIDRQDRRKKNNRD